mgnify:CR=1 FL=1
MTDILTLTAATAGAGSADSGTAILFGILPWLLIFVIFYMLMIRPQQKRMKEHREMIGAVKKGDKVVTGGGLLGRVSKVTDDEVEDFMHQLAAELGRIVAYGENEEIVAPSA